MCQRIKKKCTRGIQSATAAATRTKTTDEPYLDHSDDKDIDCILFNRMSDPKHRNNTFSLIPEIGERRRKRIFEGQDNPLVLDTSSATSFPQNQWTELLYFISLPTQMLGSVKIDLTKQNRGLSCFRHLIFRVLA